MATKGYLGDIFFPKFCSVTDNKLNGKGFNVACSIKKHVDRKIFSLSQHSDKCDICISTSKLLKSSEIQFFLEAHEAVVNSGKYNFEGCRIPVNTRMNINYMRSLLKDYKDKRVCDFLEFGFPMGVSPDFVLQSVNKKDLWKFRNHKGATDFPDDINKYLQKEIKQKSILGPFKTCPFSSGIKISPLNSVPKKDSNERRVILDLSYPKGNSVNDFISKEFYLEEKIDLMYPKVDDLVQLIKAKGKGCLLFKVDLRKAFRQLSLCPSSYRFAAYMWKKHIFFDTVLAMGSRSSSYCCQSVTNAIVFIMFKIGISVLNYLDDLASAEQKNLAEFSYRTLKAVLKKCGIEENTEKACPPATIMNFVGVLFNTEKMTVEITPERLEEIKTLLKLWLSKENASIKEVQSLLGKLNFVAACVKPARIFFSRMLKWLKMLYKLDDKQYEIPIFFKKDIAWWDRFLLTYNGVSMMMIEEFSKPDEIFSCDSCLTSCGGFWEGHFFHAVFPEKIKERGYHINILEMLAVILCLRLWGSNFKGKRIRIYSDNLSVVTVINTGKSRCEILQSCLRELTFLNAINECEVRVVHLDTHANRLADHLSRYDISDFHKQQFYKLASNYNLVEHWVHEELFDFINSW